MSQASKGRGVGERGDAARTGASAGPWRVRRGTAAGAASTHCGSPRSGPAGRQGSTDVETVRQLVKDGRAALKAGDTRQSREDGPQAQAMKVAMPFWEEDTPRSYSSTSA